MARAASDKSGVFARAARRFHQLGRRRRFGVYAIFFAFLLVINLWAANRATAVHRARVPFSPFFLTQVQQGNVAEITSKGTAIQGRLVRQTPDPSDHGGHVRSFTTEIPAFADSTGLARLLQRNRVVVNAEPLQGSIVWWKAILFGFGPTLLLLALLMWVLRRMGRSQSMLGSFGRSSARRYQGQSGATTLADVAGIDEAKAELAEIVDFLSRPEKYRRLGGRIPKGVLLAGPPGTGKTLLARAVAGEAGAPFFSMSASEFVEAIVGIGASRVRDLFAQAKDAAPAIVFIDELDAIGRSRSAAGGLGSDEREQTLNQILTEMDGFDPSVTVVVLAATNRADVLDRALLRPGRFDRRVVVAPPDRRGRKQILEVHARGVPLAADVDLERLATETPGMVGADLANLVNEAILVAARSEHEALTARDFDAAIEKLTLGTERDLILSEDDRRRTAYHEAGHALVGMLTEGADPVRKVSIVPRGTALGVTLSRTDGDRFTYTQAELFAMMRVLLGGRAAEAVALGEISTGAESDLAELTRLGRRMVGRWGMSDALGNIAALGRDDEPLMTPETVALVDAETRRLVDEIYQDVVRLLRAERGRLDRLVEALLEDETLDGGQARAAAGLAQSRV